MHTTDFFFFFLKKQTKCMVAEWQRRLFSYCGEVCCFREGLERLLSALGQSCTGVGSETCSCPSCPAVESWSPCTSAVSTFY